MTEEEKQYVRDNPDGLKWRELAVKFNVSLGVIKGIKKIRGFEVDTERAPDETKFVSEMTELKGHTWAARRLSELRGRLVSRWWALRVRRRLRAELRDAQLKSEQDEKSPPQGLSFGDL